MNYHNITKDDMINGDGLRVVLWVAGCSHKCPGCHNPITWDTNGGILFDDAAEQEIFEELKKDYISGITFSGGDPMNQFNILEIVTLAKKIKEQFPEKTIWTYSGYCLTDIIDIDISDFENEIIEKSIIKESPVKTKMDLRKELILLSDVFCDGKFQIKDKGQKHWVGSTNQHVWRLQ